MTLELSSVPEWCRKCPRLVPPGDQDGACSVQGHDLSISVAEIRCRGRGRPGRRWNLPLTYGPKIRGVRDGTICQTIRRGRTYFPGDLIAFHGWESKPYRSPWTDRTPYFRLTEAISCQIHQWGVWIGREMYDWDSLFCDDLARRDGIDPPTGSALAEVLGQLNGGLNGDGFEAQILRWAPVGRQEAL